MNRSEVWVHAAAAALTQNTTNAAAGAADRMLSLFDSRFRQPRPSDIEKARSIMSDHMDKVRDRTAEFVLTRADGTNTMFMTPLTAAATFRNGTLDDTFEIQNLIQAMQWGRTHEPQ